MLPRGDLVAAVGALPKAPFANTTFRLILARYAATALSSIGSYRSGGRFNGPGRFEALYLASSPVTALQEVEALVKTTDGLQGVKGPPRILLSVECSLQAVLDVTTPAAWTTLGTTLDELCAPWRPINATGALAPTQLLGEVVHEHTLVEALRVVSARDRAANNLVVFPDRLFASSLVRVFDDSGVIDAHLP